MIENLLIIKTVAKSSGISALSMTECLCKWMVTLKSNHIK